DTGPVAAGHAAAAVDAVATVEEAGAGAVNPMRVRSSWPVPGHSRPITKATARPTTAKRMMKARMRAKRLMGDMWASWIGGRGGASRGMCGLPQEGENMTPGDGKPPSALYCEPNRVSKGDFGIAKRGCPFAAFFHMVGFSGRR